MDMEDPSSLPETHRGTSWYFKRCAILAAFGGTFFGQVDRCIHPRPCILI